MKGYAYYISKVRELKQNDKLSDREIRRLNQQCIEKGILKDFLEKHGVEVYDMIYEPLTEEERKEIYTEDGISIGYDRGRKSGIAEGRKSGIAEGRKSGLVEGRKSGIAEGRKSGLAEGHKSGFAEGKREVAQRLKKAGLPLEVILESTGFTEKEIEEL